MHILLEIPFPPPRLDQEYRLQGLGCIEHGLDVLPNET